MHRSERAGSHRDPGTPGLGFPAALVFDLDGTLVESRHDLATAVNLLRRELGLAALPLGRITAMVGEGARMLVARALEDEIDAPGSDEALELFLRLYDGVCLATTRPYPGMAALLERLSALAPLAVLTNKPEALTRKILAGLDLGGCFAEVVAGDSLPVRKPDPAGVERLGERLGVPVARMMLIGDSPIDARTALAAGCRLALVEWGFVSPEVLAAHPAEVRARTVEELGRALLDLAVRAG